MNESAKNYGEPCCEAPEPRRTLRQEKVKTREITISEMDYGYLVRVGCQAFAIEKTDDLIEKLTMYLRNPEVTEEMYFNNKLFKK